MSRACIRTIRSLSLMFFVAVLSYGCSSKSSPTVPAGITVGDLVGTWKASSAVLTNQADASQQYHIVAEGGELRTVVLNDPARSRTWVQLDTTVDVFDQWDSGVTLNGDQLTVTPVETSRPTRHYTVQLSGDQLTLTSTDATFDFTLSGATGVPANEVDVFVRQ